MTDFHIDATGIHLFALIFPWYGIIVVAAAWIAAELAAWIAKRTGRHPEHVWRGLIWVSVFGLIGARLWFVLFPPDSVVVNGLTAGWLMTHAFDLNQGAIAVWTGGLGIMGGMLGGALGLLIYTKRNKLPILPWLDIAAIALPLAQTIGRLGNFINQDLYGPVTTLPWGMLVDKESQRVGPYTDLARYPLEVTRFHPVWLYEMIGTALIFGLLMLIFLRYRQRMRFGMFALLYLVLYGVVRAILEFMRVNPSHLGGVLVRLQPESRPPTGSLHSFDSQRDESSLQLGKPE
jgi:phosphatidylglycerol---prolipoprotein diacylglyceryl transferase